MRLIATFLVVALLLSIQGCGHRLSKARPESTEVSTPPAPPVMPPPLSVIPAQSPLLVEWGASAEISLALNWIDSRVQPVLLTVSSESPRWLSAELPPDTLHPPTTVRLRLAVKIGSAPPGPASLILTASSLGLDSVQRVELPILIRRVTGSFAAVEHQLQSQTCSTFCGCVNLYSQLDFYTLRPETGQTCADSPALPDSQRLGGRTFPLGVRGFGYSPACVVAVVWESTGMVSFVNLGLSTALPRGAVLTTLRGGGDVWLSPDETVALVRFNEFLVPYDVPTGRQLGNPCGIDGAVSPPVLTGDSLRAGTCAWQIL